MASNDFRSLLSTFQAASSGETVVSNNNASLLEATTQLWRLAQLKKTMKRNKKQQTHTTNDSTHLAVCLCIVDNLPHEDIWRYWIESLDSESASLYIHAKHPEKITSEWTRSKLLPISHKPNWNDVKIVKAMLSLAQEALKNRQVTHVYFGTESCLPVVTLQQALITLQHGKSYLKFYDKSQASRFEERECWSPVEQFVPSDAIFKALPGWCVLCRSHVQAILDILSTSPCLELWKAFESCWAPEELYFATALSLLGLLNSQEVENRSLVHVEWNTRAQNHADRAHPRDLDDDFDQDFVRHVSQDKQCLFVRKVKRRMPLQYWKRVVLGESSYAAGGKRSRGDSDQGDRSAHARSKRRHSEDRHHYKHEHSRYQHDRRR